MSADIGVNYFSRGNTYQNICDVMATLIWLLG